MRSSNTEDLTPYRKRSPRKAKRPAFGIEVRYAHSLLGIQRKQRWNHWKWYDTEKQRDKALEGLRNQAKGHIIRDIEYRPKKR